MSKRSKDKPGKPSKHRRITYVFRGPLIGQLIYAPNVVVRVEAPKRDGEGRR